MFRALVFALGAGLARTDGRVTSRSKSQPEKIPPLDRSLLPWLGAKNEYYRRINRTRVPSETLPNYPNESGDQDRDALRSLRLWSRKRGKID